MENTESGKTEVGISDVLKELSVTVERIRKIVFGDKPKVAEEGRPLASDLIIDIRNQINELNDNLSQSANRLELLR